MGKAKLEETYIFKISMKIRFIYVYIGIKFRLLEYWLLLSRVTPCLQFVTTNCWIKFAHCLRIVFEVGKYEHIFGWGGGGQFFCKEFFYGEFTIGGGKFQGG